MNNLEPLWIITTIVMSITVLAFSGPINGQAQPTGSTPPNQVMSNTNSVVSVSSSVTVQVSNDSLKAKDGMLRSAVSSFLNSGPNVLKTSPSDQPVVKSKISNLISNDTQSVEGIEATNAIVAVEVSKAIKTAVSTSDKPGQSAMVTIQTSSTCKPLATKSISCDNTVTIK